MSSVQQEEITTIFVVGFPDDMKEREFQNLFLFAEDFEGAVLKIPSYSPLSQIYPVVSTPPFSPLKTDDFSAQSEGLFEAASGCNALSPASSSAPIMPIPLRRTNSFQNNQMVFQSVSRKQIIGFARFKSQKAAIRAIDFLCGKRIDPDRCSLVLKAELAKKNLLPKKNCISNLEGLDEFESTSRMNSLLCTSDDMIAEQGSHDPALINGDLNKSLIDNLIDEPLVKEANGALHSGRGVSCDAKAAYKKTRSQSFIGFDQYMIKNYLESDLLSRDPDADDSLLVDSVTFDDACESICGSCHCTLTSGINNAGSSLFSKNFAENVIIKPPLLSSLSLEKNSSLFMSSEKFSSKTATINQQYQNDSFISYNYSENALEGKSYSNSMQPGDSNANLYYENNLNGEKRQPSLEQVQPIQKNFYYQYSLNENPPCNTLYVGNIPLNTSEEELFSMFCQCPGFKRLSFKIKNNSPMCFVEFGDIHMATNAMNSLYGAALSTSTKGGIRLAYSKNPLGVKSNRDSFIPYQHHLDDAMNNVYSHPSLYQYSQANGADCIVLSENRSSSYYGHVKPEVRADKNIVYA